MPPKKNPLKLNKLQLRTLTLAQLLARDPGLVRRDEPSLWCLRRRLAAGAVVVGAGDHRPH